MTSFEITIRPETGLDVDTVRAIHEQAFPTPAEARMVDLLRANGKASISLVAELEGQVVGHILFSPVTVSGSDSGGLGLAPVAILPAHQARGIGSRLIRDGLAQCRERGTPYAVVLGSPAFYGRFGFGRASMIGLGNEYGVDEEFMAIELTVGALPPEGGLVCYAPEFAEAEVDANDPKP
jgi:putative acetyltransferase